MPSTPHMEKHFTAGESVRDIVIGMSDGFELGLEKPNPSRAWKSALTIACAYIVGGIISLSAYLFLSDPQVALRWSATVTLLALAVFGGIKGRFTGVPVIRSALQATLIGGLAAAAAFGIARLIA